MADVVDTVQAEIVGRLSELAPLVVEFERLTVAAAALDGLERSVGAVSAPRAPANNGVAPKPRRGGPVGSTPRKRASTKAASPAVDASATAVVEVPELDKPRRGKGRRKGPNTRAIQAVALITERPGITIPELAAEMKVNRTGMYRILPGPEMEGLIRREGNGWFPVLDASSS